MAFVRGNLTAEQQAKIVSIPLKPQTASPRVSQESIYTNLKEANRKRALERRQQRGLAPPSATTSATALTTQVQYNSSTLTQKPLETNKSPLKRPRIELTPQQRLQIEENRKKAIEIQKKKQQQNRNAEQTTKSQIAPEVAVASTRGVDVRLPKEVLELASDKKTTSDKKSNKKDIHHINKRDYIEYDLSTMKDTLGGFLDDQNDNGFGPIEPENPRLEEWKEKQKRDHIVKEMAPPLDISTAPKCFECGSLEIDQNLYQNFRQVRVCRPCAREKPEKYALLTKTECKEDYLLTDPELRDTELLSRIEKPNPHGFSRMQLFLRLQVEEFAWKKWGGPDKLDEEWERRERVRLQRKEKKYEDKLKEMRKRTRAEEYTRKLRNGESLGQKHVHDWSEPLEQGDHLRRRCIDCGMETEEVLI